MMLWLNGALLPDGEARINPADRGFTLGDGLFETLAVRDGKILRLEKHLRRLGHGCEVLRLPPPPDGLAEAIAAVLQANALKVTLGSGSRNAVLAGRFVGMNRTLCLFCRWRNQTIGRQKRNSFCRE